MRSLFSRGSKKPKEKCQVTFLIRFVAYVIDWIIGGTLAGLPAVFAYAQVSHSNEMYSDLYVFPALGTSYTVAYVVGFSCLLIGLFYYIWVPLKKYPGQTIGKKIMRIKVVKMDESKPLDFKTLFIRQFIGLVLLEGVALSLSNYVRQMITLATGVYVDYWMLGIGSFITICSTMLVFCTKSARSLHDYLAGTKLIALYDAKLTPAEQRIKRKQEKKALKKAEKKAEKQHA